MYLTTVLLGNTCFILLLQNRNRTRQAEIQGTKIKQIIHDYILFVMFSRPGMTSTSSWALVLVPRPSLHPPILEPDALAKVYADLYEERLVLAATFLPSQSP